MQKCEYSNRLYTDAVEFMTGKSLENIYKHDVGAQSCCSGPDPCDEKMPNRRLRK